MASWRMAEAAAQESTGSTAGAGGTGSAAAVTPAARRITASKIGEEIRVDSRRLVALSLRPAIFRIDAFLSSDECDHIIAASRGRFRSSYVTGGGSVSASDVEEGEQGNPNAAGATLPGGGETDYRTSTTAWLPMSSDPILASIQNRTAQLCGLSLGDFLPLAEDLQVVHYGVGEQFGLHHDSSAGFQRRDLTLLMYLSEVEAGGETLFPEAQVQVKDGEGMKSDAAVEVDRGGDSLVRTGLRVQPRQGMALLFYNLDPETHAPDPMAVHAALPVLRGEKHAANFWLNRR